MMSVKDVLITGGTRNTGFGISKAFAAKGYRLHITGRKLSEVQASAEKIRAEYPGVEVFPYVLELSSVENIRQVFGEIKENSGKLDVLVANAGHLGVDLDIYNTDEAMYDAVMDVNAKGNFFCCQEAARLMKKSGGSIVLISSVQSKGAVEGRTVYGMSKAALNMLGKTLAFDLAPLNIRCNTLIVGAVHSDRWDILDEETVARRRSAYPLGKESDVEDIANAVLYFAEDTSKMVTGAELVIDSGLMVPILPYRDRVIKEREDF